MSLLTSIFGSNSNEKEEDGSGAAADELFANPVSVPPPPLATTAAAATATKRAAASPRNPRSSNQKEEDEEERTVFVGNLPVHTTRKDLAKLFQRCGTIASTRIRNVPTSADQTVKIAKAGRPGVVQKVRVNTAVRGISGLDTRYQASVQGYVVFTSPDAIPAALRLHNTPFTLLSKKGPSEDDTTTTSSRITRHIRVDRVHTAAQDYDAKRSVFIGNLPYHADEEALRTTLLQHSKGADWNTSNTADSEEGNNDPSDDAIQGIRLIRDATTHQCKGFGYVLLKSATHVSYALRHWNQHVVYENRPLRVRVCGTRFKSQTKQTSSQGGATVASHKKASSSSAASSPSVAASLRQMVVAEQHTAGHRNNKNKRKRGTKRNSQSTAGQSKRAVAAKKTQQRIHKIETRLRKGMGKMRKA